MFGTDVREYSIDGDTAVLSDLDSRTVSSPSPMTLGRRPIANITLSAATVLWSESRVTNSSPDVSTAATVWPQVTVMPRLRISLRKCSRTSSSKPRRIFSPR